MAKYLIYIALLVSASTSYSEEFDTESAQRVADVFNQHNMLGMQASHFYCSNGRWPELWQELKEFPCQFESCKRFTIDWDWIESGTVDRRTGQILVIELPNRENEPATEFLAAVIQPPACIFGEVLSNIHIGPWGRENAKPMLNFSDDP